MLKLGTSAVFIPSTEVQDFVAKWPGAGFLIQGTYYPVTFEFDNHGNLLDIISPYDWTEQRDVDAKAINALCDDAKTFLRQGKKYA